MAHLGGWKQRNGRVVSKWKPTLVYSKGEWTKEGEWFDVSIINSKEKEWHDWQQPLEQVERLVKDFSEPGDLVVDPLGGGFTTAVACKSLGRKCISCDIDEKAVIRGQDRLAGKSSDEHPALSSIGSPSNTELLLVMVRRLEVLERDILGTDLGEENHRLIDKGIEVLRRLRDVATKREVVA